MGVPIAIILKLLLLMYSLPTLAFQNSYLSFELPEQRWHCKERNLVWTCQPKDHRLTPQAFVTISAKATGPEDNLNLYFKKMGQPRTPTTGKINSPSKVIHTKNRMIGSQQWVESLHFESEVKNFYTLYLASIKGNLAVAVSFSAEKNQIQRFNEIFKQAVKSLKIQKFRVHGPGVIAPHQYTAEGPALSPPINDAGEIEIEAPGSRKVFGFSIATLIYAAGGFLVLLTGALIYVIRL